MPENEPGLPTVMIRLLLLPALAGLASGQLWAQTTTERPIAVSGTLVDERGTPAAGVEVLLRPYPSQFELDLDVLGIPEALPAAVDRARSDADGAFSVSAPVPGPYRLEIRPSAPTEPTGAVAPLVYGILAPLAASRVLEPNELPDRHRVAVRILDPDDQPIEGALVIAAPTSLRSARYERTTSRQRPRRLYPRFHRAAAKTDVEGVARFLMPTIEAEIVTAAPGFAIGTARTEAGRAALRLKRDTGVRVRVRDPKGTQAPGVLIRAHGENSIPLALTNQRGEALVSSGDDAGTTYEFEDVDHRLASAPASPPPVPAAQSASDQVVQVRLEPALRVPGRVVDAASGIPVDNATVWAVSFPGHATSTDRAGGFELSTRPGGTRAALAVNASGYLSAQVNVADERSAPAEVSILLEPAAPLSGLVRDAADQPVARASIQAAPLEARPRVRREPPVTASDAEGSFHIADAEYDRPYRLTVRARGFPNTVVHAPPLERGAVPEPVRIVLTKGRRTSGHVVDTEGAPVAGAEVRLRRPPESDRTIFFDQLDATEPTTTDEHGGFGLPPVSAGEYEMRIVHAEYVSPGHRRVEVPGGEGSFDLGSFTLVPGAEILGVVSDPEGLPVADATVEVRRFGPDRDQERSTTTGLDGTFRLTGLPHDLVDLSVHAEGFAPLTLRGARPDTGEPILIELQKGATLSGRVVNDNGNAAAGASVTLLPDTETLIRVGTAFGRDAYKQTGSDGRFRFENVGAGTWSLEADDGDARARLDAIELTTGTERVVELQLDAWNRLTVIVTTFQGEPLSEAAILVRPDSTLYSSDFGTTDTSGRARIGITPGPATVLTRHEKYQDDMRDVVLEPGSNELTVQLGPGGIIAGTVRSADGTPLAAATVEAHPEDDLDTAVRYRRYNDSAQTMSNRQGQFRIAGLEPGRYFLVGRAPGFAADGPDQAFDIDGQSVDGADIVLRPGGSIVGIVSGLNSTELSQVRIEASQQARWQTTAPDTEGNFALKDLAAGEWKVVARKSESSAGRAVERIVTLGPGSSEALVELPFETGLRLSGQVFVAGEPMISGSLVAVPPDDGEVQWTDTDHLGRFEMSGLQPGPYDLRIQEMNGSTEHRSIDLQSDLEGLRIDLQRPASVVGVVVDGTTGQPLAYAWLTAGSAQQIAGLRRDSPRSGSAGEAMSEDGGRFTIRFGPGAEQLWVEREGYQDAILSLNVVPGQRQEGIVIRLQPETSEAPER